jgi:hypothetical protein
MSDRPRAAWMFEDWPQKSARRDLQQLSMAILRIRVVAVDNPVRSLVRWLDTRLGAGRT